MSIMDIIQEGSIQLCKAVDKIDRTKLFESEDIEKTLKSLNICELVNSVSKSVGK